MYTDGHSMEGFGALRKLVEFGALATCISGSCSFVRLPCALRLHCPLGRIEASAWFMLHLCLTFSNFFQYS